MSTIYIGHASINESGKATGGLPGDQTGKEVCVRTYYNSNWDIILRFKNRSKATVAAKFCEAICNGNHVGYDQNRRNTLRAEAKLVGFNPTYLKNNCDTDCSAFMTVCAEAAGINMNNAYTSGNAPVTQNMRMKFMATGEFDLITFDKNFDIEKLAIGDILVRESGHTAMVLTNGDKVSDTSSSNTSKKTVTEIAKEVIKGKWGVGQGRANALRAAGYNYSEVQEEVNNILYDKTLTSVARKVIAGLYGVGSDRKTRLEKDGYNYDDVQRKVNEILK